MDLITPNMLWELHKPSNISTTCADNEDTLTTKTTTIIYGWERSLTVAGFQTLMKTHNWIRNNSTTRKFETPIRPYTSSISIDANSHRTSRQLPPFICPPAFERSNFGKQRTNGCRYTFLHRLRTALVTCNMLETTKDKRDQTKSFRDCFSDKMIMHFIFAISLSFWMNLGGWIKRGELIKWLVIWWNHEHGFWWNAYIMPALVSVHMMT